MADPAVTAAWIASAAAVVGPLVTWAVTRRKVDSATVELTDAQAEQIRGQVWAQLNDTLRAEIIRLQGRITDLETRLTALDLETRKKGEELAATQAERDQLRIQLAAAHAELQAKEREIGDLKQALARAAA
jgi:chromosome segregation ATPase